MRLLGTCRVDRGARIWGVRIRGVSVYNPLYMSLLISVYFPLASLVGIVALSYMGVGPSCKAVLNISLHQFKRTDR